MSELSYFLEQEDKAIEYIREHGIKAAYEHFYHIEKWEDYERFEYVYFSGAVMVHDVKVFINELMTRQMDDDKLSDYMDSLSDMFSYDIQMTILTIMNMENIRHAFISCFQSDNYSDDEFDNRIDAQVDYIGSANKILDFLTVFIPYIKNPTNTEFAIIPSMDTMIDSVAEYAQAKLDLETNLEINMEDNDNVEDNKEEDNNGEEVDNIGE